MAQYRCYFFGSNGQLVGADTIIEDSDAQAVIVARQLYTQRAFATGFDLREGSRSVDAHNIQAVEASRAA